AEVEEVTVRVERGRLDIEAGPPRAQADLDEAGRLILAFLDKATEPVAEADLDGAIECRRQVWKKALRGLVGTGKVIKTGRGGKGDPFRYSGSLSYSGTTEPAGLFRA